MASGPFESILRYGVDALATFGGYDKRDEGEVTDPDIQVSADEANRMRGGIAVDMLGRLRATDVWVTDYSTDAAVVGSGSAATDTAAFVAAAARCISTGARFVVPHGLTYRLTQAVIVEGATRFSAIGFGDHTIVFPSSDTGLTGTAAYDLAPANQRSAFYLRNCVDPKFEGLTFLGDDVETNIATNSGLAISVYKTTRLRVDLCVQRYGGGLVSQTNETEDVDAIVSRCFSYGSRANSRLGASGTFDRCTFELPDTLTYDATSIGLDRFGSSHAIYYYGTSGNRNRVINCTFRRIRLEGFKVSASAAAKTAYTVAGCTFIQIGVKSDGTYATGSAILFGADDVQAHNMFSALGNEFVDCNSAMSILGSRSVLIDKNHIYITVAPPTPVSAHISVARYAVDMQPVEVVAITNNIISAPSSIGGGSIATTAIQIANVGEVGTTAAASNLASSVRVTGNTVAWAAATAFASTRCIAPRFSQNTVIGCGQFILLTEDRMPLVEDNDVINQQSNNAQIRHSHVTFPRYRDNRGAGTVGGFAGKVQIGSNANGSSGVRFPLLGFSGYATPANGTREVVMGYGGDWIANDTVDLNGTTLTYVTGTPTGNQFNSFATLVTLINGTGTFDCVEYDPTGEGLASSRHLKITRPTDFYVKTTCKRKTAGVILVNYAVLQDRCNSRGDTAGDVIIWSPCYSHDSPPSLLADNASGTGAATAAKVAGGFYRVRVESGDEQASCTLRFVAALAGTELVAWEV